MKTLFSLIQVGTLICGPVAQKKSDGQEFQRLDSSLIVVGINEATNEFSFAREYSAADFKDAKFDGKLGLKIKGQILDDTHSEEFRGKFILTASYYHYTQGPDGKKIVHGSGFSQANAFEPLTGTADGDDAILKGAGATCVFLAGK